MSYLVLARKWRPQLFEEIVGQESITKTLANSIAKSRIPHALLFTGVRGVGKTTAARIFAKALNCEKGPTVKPCNTCANCREIAGGSSMDVLEIDGASNTSVNDVRELRENVRYLPSKSKFKVYIIDEVHMLSESAFNALLKTLEEPPDNVIFMFATTEPESIPQTIISRCQRFDLKPIPEDKIMEKLRSICDAEKFSVSDFALKIVAREGKGSMRDALSIMDKLLAFGGDGIKDDEVVETLGLIKREVLLKAVSSIAEKDSASLILLIDEIYAEGYDPKVFVSELLEHIRNLLVLKVDPSGKLAKLPEGELAKMKEIAGKASIEELQFVFDILKEAAIEISRSDYQRFILELALLRAASVTPLLSIDKLIESIDGKPGAHASAGHPKQVPNLNKDAKEKPVEKKTLGEEVENPSARRDLKADWPEIVASIKAFKPSLAAALENAYPSASEKHLKICFEKDSFHSDMVNEEKNLDLIRKAVSERGHGDLQVAVELSPDKAKKSGRSADGEEKLAQGGEPKESPSKTRTDDPVKRAVDIFNGRVEN